MSIVRRRVTVPLTGNADVNLSPFDRFAGRGGSVTVKATATATEQDDITLSLMVGSDIIADNYAVGAEAVAGQGPNKDTPSVSGIGAPADPITLNIQNANAAARVVAVEAEIVNA
jgi:hypothetical protein